MRNRKGSHGTVNPPKDSVSDDKLAYPQKKKGKGSSNAYPPEPEDGSTDPRSGNIMAAWMIYIVMGVLIFGSYYFIMQQHHDKTERFLANAEKYQTPIVKNFKGVTLGYVTPWHSKGYDVAKTFNTKFDILVPVWYQFFPTGTNNYTLQGGHDVDKGWLQVVRRNGKGAKVMPRFIAERFDGTSMEALLRSAAEQKALFDTFIKEIKIQGYDGMTLELWGLLGGYANEPLAALCIELAEVLHREGLQMVLVIPPYRPEGNQQSRQIFGVKDFRALAPYVDYFSLMTYDFSNGQQPGPSSPPKWIKYCYSQLIPNDSSLTEYSHKILLGLNFYGNDFTLPNGGGPIVAKDLFNTMQQYKPVVEWEPIYKEHMAKYMDSNGRNHHIYFPSSK
eukprot:Ihof_evm2s704 gene=Ihof_evmTU2s704